MRGVAILVATALLLLAGCGHQVASTSAAGIVTISVASSQQLSLTVVGDSLDAGLYATTPQGGFHGLLVAELRTLAPVVDRPLSVVGGTSARALGNAQFPAGQDLYIIELGTNDVAEVDAGTFRDNYRRLLDRVLAASPQAHLLCVGVWRPEQISKRFDVIIKDTCETRGGVFRQLADLFDDAELRGPAGRAVFGGKSDDFHPNDRGHKAIAERLEQAIVVQRI
ncbi:SGNH/GDSL hydrolase family protein [Pseudonocardia sp.]|uniref:SGNH/GDSL hydrolase family protein n=1 Tax=Pseudonocardia sp. TaxID=60912 RepID=UPI003D152D3C